MAGEQVGYYFFFKESSVEVFLMHKKVLSAEPQQLKWNRLPCLHKKKFSFILAQYNLYILLMRLHDSILMQIGRLVMWESQKVLYKKLW